MEENKADEIKEALKNTMDLDTIEEQLKEKTSRKSTAPKREPKKETSPLSDPYPNIKLNISEEKRRKNNNLNAIIIILVLITILLFSLLYFQLNNVEENIDSKTPDKIEKKIDEKEVIKVNEPKEIKVEEKEIQKNEIVAKILKKTENKDIIEIPKETVAIKEEVKESLKEEKYNIISKEKSFKDYYNSTKYKKLTCYDFKAGTTRPTDACKKELKKFLITNKDTIRLEVIAVIGEDDIKLFDKLDNIKLNNLKSNKVKDFMLRGLGRERVLETTWFIKETLGDDVVLTPTNYYVTSKKNNKGFLIKAYH